MSLTVQWYRHDDASAPTPYDSQAGSLIRLLDACLVNGYGAKPAAGWTKEFSGTNIAVYRNNLTDGGSGCYVRIDDTLGDYVKIVTYSSMSDINTGVNGTLESTLHKTSSPSSTVRPWWLWADGLTFYVYVESNYTDDFRKYSFGGAGDFAPYWQSNPYPYFTLAGEAGTSFSRAYNKWAGAGGGDCTGLGIVDPSDGVAKTPQWLYPNTHYTSWTDGNLSPSGSSVKAPFGVSETYMLKPVLTYSDSADNTYPVGYMRGVVLPASSFDLTMTPGELIPGTDYVFTPVNCYTYSSNTRYAGALFPDSVGPW